MWYFVKLSHSRLFRRKKFFDVNSAKKGVSLSVKPSATYTSSNKDTAYPDIKRHVFSPPTSFSCKMRSKNLRSYNSKTPVNSNKFFLTPESAKYMSSAVMKKVMILEAII